MKGTATSKAEDPLAIQVQDLKKTFQIPTHRVDSLKERIVRPFSGRNHRELRALDGVSFEIRQGEFFGIVGRNGSGKSTLLKLMASIYRADAGTIRMAGRLAPFIELGVGFNAELTARENVVLNGVMMGLTPKETRSRLDSILEFAELEDFVDLKLKNYSSGMLVRLAFSTMMQADADILLIDEVLAVGDAAFQQKCADAFREMKNRGKTIVLVTHAMEAVEEYCHRAMLLEDGKIVHSGDPAEVGRQYLRLNFESEAANGAANHPQSANDVRLLKAWIEGADGEPTTSLEHGSEIIRLRVEIEMLEEMDGIHIGFIIANADGVGVFQFGKELPRSLEAGEQLKIAADLENPLVAGRYFVHCGIRPAHGQRVSLYAHNAADFVVFGGRAGGIVWLRHEITAAVKESAE